MSRGLLAVSHYKHVIYKCVVSRAFLSPLHARQTGLSFPTGGLSEQDYLVAGAVEVGCERALAILNNDAVDRSLVSTAFNVLLPETST
jgi:hypothetical protein